jgi:hypothetical protein
MSRLRYRVGTLFISLMVLPAFAAHADQLEQHDNLVQKFVNEQHASPLVADCAAHASFVVSTSSYFDHAEFPANTLDDEHAKTQPWNDAFDNGKQRIKVDTIVTVTGEGVRKDPQAAPESLTFKCGYVDNKMLAFSYNDPVPPAVSHASAKHHGKPVRGAHGSKGTHAQASSKHSTKARTQPAKSRVVKKPSSKTKKTAG